MQAYGAEGGCILVKDKLVKDKPFRLCNLPDKPYGFAMSQTTLTALHSPRQALRKGQAGERQALRLCSLPDLTSQAVERLISVLFLNARISYGGS